MSACKAAMISFNSFPMNGTKLGIPRRDRRLQNDDAIFESCRGVVRQAPLDNLQMQAFFHS